MSDILTWQERCEKHPDHQQGMVTHAMITQRMQEEIDDLREKLSEALAPLREAAAAVVYIYDDSSAIALEDARFDDAIEELRAALLRMKP